MSVNRSPFRHLLALALAGLLVCLSVPAFAATDGPPPDTAPDLEAPCQVSADVDQAEALCQVDQGTVQIHNVCSAAHAQLGQHATCDAAGDVSGHVNERQLHHLATVARAPLKEPPATSRQLRLQEAVDDHDPWRSHLLQRAGERRRTTLKRR